MHRANSEDTSVSSAGWSPLLYVLSISCFSFKHVSVEPEPSWCLYFIEVFMALFVEERAWLVRISWVSHVNGPCIIGYCYWAWITIGDCHSFIVPADAVVIVFRKVQGC